MADCLKSRNAIEGSRLEILKTKNLQSMNCLEVFVWRRCWDSNPDLTLRRGLFYPVELQRRCIGTIFVPLGHLRGAIVAKTVLVFRKL